MSGLRKQGFIHLNMSFCSGKEAGLGWSPVGLKTWENAFSAVSVFLIALMGVQHSLVIPDVRTSPQKANAGVPSQGRQPGFMRTENILPLHGESSAMRCLWAKGLGPSFTGAGIRAWMHCTGKEKACKQQLLKHSLVLDKPLPFCLFFYSIKMLVIRDQTSQQCPPFSCSAR